MYKRPPRAQPIYRRPGRTIIKYMWVGKVRNEGIAKLSPIYRRRLRIIMFMPNEPQSITRVVAPHLGRRSSKARNSRDLENKIVDKETVLLLLLLLLLGLYAR